ncbi:hypothetical protein EV714DRAFT_277013 [Schizophyllum commune]
MSSHANAQNTTPSAPAGPVPTVYSRITPIDVQQRGVFGRLKNRFRVALRPNLTRSLHAHEPDATNGTTIHDPYTATGNDLGNIRLAIEQQTGVFERGMDQIASAIHSAALALNRSGGGDDDDDAPSPPGAHRQGESDDSGSEGSNDIPDPAAREGSDTHPAGSPTSAPPDAPDAGSSGHTRSNDPKDDPDTPASESHPRPTPTAQPQCGTGATHSTGDASSQNVPPPVSDPRSPLVDSTALRQGSLRVVESIRSDCPTAQASADPQATSSVNPAPNEAQAANRDDALPGLALSTFASPGSTSAAPSQSTLFQVPPSSSEKQTTYEDINDNDTFISFYVESVTDGPYLGARLCIYVGSRDELRGLLAEPSRFCHGLTDLAPRCEANKHQLTQLRIVLHKSSVTDRHCNTIDVLATVLKALCSCRPCFLAAHVEFAQKDHARYQKGNFSDAQEFLNAFSRLRHVRLEGCTTAARLTSFPLSMLNSLELLINVNETDVKELISRCPCLHFLSVRRITTTSWECFVKTTDKHPCPRLPVLEITSDVLSRSFMDWVKHTDIFRLNVSHPSFVGRFKSDFRRQLTWSLYCS